MALLLTLTQPRELLPGLQNSMVFGAAGGGIGRGQDNDWVLSDPLCHLSVHHARVRFHQGAYFIDDTSTNGVFLNGARQPLGKQSSPALRHGDRLRMGVYEVQVSIDDSPAESAPRAAPLIDRRRVPRTASGSSPELDAFCRGAGIPASELPRGAYLEVLQLAGMMLREALIGARELAKSRREILRSAGLKPSAEESGAAVLQRYSIEELLKQFLAIADPSLPEAIPWLRDTFSNARRNDAAFVQATREALADFLRRLEPAALATSGTAAEQFRALTDMRGNTLPALYVEALARHLGALLKQPE